MAFSADTDYKALQNELQKQIDAETNPTKKAQLQSQWNAYEQSRNEKIASDLNRYGQYASDSQLDSAAGIIATNQVGNAGYGVQRQNLNAAYDQARQNASNDALSRGMARSTYVSDRMANLDSDRAVALSNVDAARAEAIQNAKTSILDNYRTNAANAADAAKSDSRDQISTILSAGGTVGDSLWANSGYDESTVNALKAYAAQQAAASTSSTGDSGNGGGGGVNNGSLTSAQVKELQNYYGVTADGSWGTNSSNAAGGLSADDAWAKYQAATATVTGPQTIIADINTQRAQGYTNAQIKQIAKQMYESGAITGAEYQMYVQYSGS